LVLNIFSDHIRIKANRINAIALSPKVISPIRFFDQAGKRFEEQYGFKISSTTVDRVTKQSVFLVFRILFRILDRPVVATSALFAVFLFVSGLQFLFFGMWMDIKYNNNNKVK
jgi:hypothetical protein